MKNGFLIDMDGVIYKGSVPIPGAVDSIADLIHSPLLSKNKAA